MIILLIVIVLAKLLTPRWFEIPEKAKYHSVQNQIIEDQRKKLFTEIIVAAGRRSFKTERFGKRLPVSLILPTKDERYFFGAPTRLQAKEIFWKDIKDLIPSWAMSRQPSESELKIFLRYGTEIKIVGLEAFKRIQGGRCHGFVISEYQDCDPGVFSESIEPMLNDTGGWCIKEGRPFGKNHFFDDYRMGIKRENGVASYHWKSRDILSDTQINKAMGRLSQIDYEREYDASFETAFGAPYHAFSERNYEKFPYNPSLPTIVTCDFNATEKPMSWVVGQKTIAGIHSKTYWQKSLSFQYTNTEMMCSILDDHFKARHLVYPSHVKFYGEYHGKKKTSNSSFSDWQIIENYFKNKFKIERFTRACLSIRDSIAATNAQLCNTLKEYRQFVDPNECKELVRDFEHAEWEANSKELKDNNVLIGHACRAVDYYNYYEHPVQITNTFKESIAA